MVTFITLPGANYYETEVLVRGTVAGLMMGKSERCYITKLHHC